MKAFVSNFFSADLRIRAAVLLAILILIFWWALGKVIIKLASILPYLLRIVFKGVYLLIELPICWLHDRAGSLFHEIDNGLAHKGDKIDTFLERWYSYWHHPQKKHIFLSFVVYFLLIGWICITYTDEPNVKFFSGQRAYLCLENKLTDYLETKNLFEERIEEAAKYEEPQSEEEENSSKIIAMKVVTRKDPLSVRDIPSTKNCEILQSIEKGSTVSWEGDIAFEDGQDGGIEPWIKVETPDGTIGWARLKYLCPVDENDLTLKLKIKK